jgi:hypothetical protein
MMQPWAAGGVGEVRFQAFAGDHAGARTAHLHAFTGSGEVVVELLLNGDVRLSQAHGAAVRGTVTSREQRVVLAAARDHHTALMMLWEASQPK